MMKELCEGNTFLTLT